MVSILTLVAKNMEDTKGMREAEVKNYLYFLDWLRRMATIRSPGMISFIAISMSSCDGFPMMVPVGVMRTLDMINYFKLVGGRVG